MRIRSIKPEFFKHDVIGTMSPLYRLLFIGLWCMADSEGRMEDRPLRIKAEILPYDNDNIETLLEGLEKEGFIIRYVVEDQRLIEIPSFQRHQRITGKELETPSRFPAPPKKKTGKQRGNNGETPGITGREGKGDGKETIADFELFWSVYPKKVAKESARKAFAKVEIPTTDLVAAVNRHRELPQWIKQDGAFIPYASTWLNQRRWEDNHAVELFEPPSPTGAYDADPNSI